MNRFDYVAALPAIRQLAALAGERIMEIYSTDFSVKHKADETPVTAADMAAHHVILDGLHKLTPSIPVLSEESAEIPFATRVTWDRYWLIDPLDGTREFVKRNGEFTVNIALVINHQPVLGVVQAPVTGVCYSAASGAGAYRHDTRESTTPIHVRPLGPGPVTIAGSRAHPGRAFGTLLESIGEHVVISVGSSLKSCMVAEGTADLYARRGPTSEWDTAAAQCIVEEAGGRITDTRMRPLRYNTKPSLLNPHFFVAGDPTVDWSAHLPRET